MTRRVFGAAALFWCVLLPGCAVTPGPPSIRLALDGPPLHIAVNGMNARYGAMDRSCMAGVGTVAFFDENNDVLCRGTMDRPGSDKGRLYAELQCKNGDAVTLAMRNLGPDQGMGVGRVTTKAGDSGERLVLFYHPSEDEANRRLAQVKADIATGEKERERRKESDTRAKDGEAQDGT